MQPVPMRTHSMSARSLRGALSATLVLALVAGLLAVAAPVASAPRATAVAEGIFHTCALTDVGGVKCWGWNQHGQLGDGTTHDRLTPVDVVGLTSGVVAISAGGDHTCALTDVGGVKCWGKNRFGELGDGTTHRRLAPVDVAGLTSGVSAITAGGDHTCALTDTGGVACWGVNRYGQLGDGTNHGRSTPTAVSGLGTGVVSVSAGKYHTCALTDAGGVRCWGYNGEGELGDGTRHDRSTATRVLGLASGIAEVSAGGFHTCALTDVGTAACWGWNQSGLLGDGTTVPRRLRPVAVDGLRHLMAVAAGGAHSCALTVAGAMTCWGENDQLQLGDGTTVNRRHPVGVVGLGRGVSAIALGSSHTCAVTTVGRVACWGTNHYGKLGDGTLFGRMIPVTVRGFTAGPGTYRPDASIAKMPPSPWVGGDALDPSGKAQTVSVRVQPGGTGTTRVRIQNDGDRLDQFFLEGTGGRGGFAVRYRSDAEIVTGEITGARFWVGRPPGEAFALHIQVAVGSAVPDGAHLVVFLACRSAHESEVVDAVRMEIEIVSSTRAVGGRGA